MNQCIRTYRSHIRLACPLLHLNLPVHPLPPPSLPHHPTRILYHSPYHLPLPSPSVTSQNHPRQRYLRSPGVLSRRRSEVSQSVQSQYRAGDSTRAAHGQPVRGGPTNAQGRLGVCLRVHSGGFLGWYLDGLTWVVVWLLGGRPHSKCNFF